MSTPRNCPRCHTRLSGVAGATPWCGACWWDLDAYDTDRAEREFGWTWLDRATFRLAFRLNKRQFQELTGRSVGQEKFGYPHIVLTIMSLLVMSVVLALFIVGGWLVARDFPALWILPGLILIGLGVVCLPRMGRLGDRSPLTREAAPALFDVTDQIAGVIGTKPVDYVVLDTSFNASVEPVGWRRRRVLTLGLPLWAALAPQERVALLGHEFGHLVNGDLRRNLLTSPAYSALEGLYDVTRPVDGVDSSVDHVSTVIATAGLAQRLAKAAQWLISRGLLAGYLVVVWIGHRAAHRAVYHADELAAAVGGSAATASLADVLLASDSMNTAIRSAARAGIDTVSGFRAVADKVRQDRAEQMPTFQQLSIREEASLFAGHPPSGLRRRLVESRPYESARVALSDADSQRIDDELAPHYARARRDLAWNV